MGEETGLQISDHLVPGLEKQRGNKLRINLGVVWTQVTRCLVTGSTPSTEDAAHSVYRKHFHHLNTF